MQTDPFPSWLKSKGYIHITPPVDIAKNGKFLLKKIQNKSFIARYAFYPLLHTTIKERRYKRTSIDSNTRAHSYIDDKGNILRNFKERPIHYATHMDALIFGYYASILQEKYDKRLLETDGLSDCVIAYRKIASSEPGKHKSTIHFADEIFKEVKRQARLHEECVVLTFDIKSFFSSLDHHYLKKAWSELLEEDRLPADHYAVFKATTQFSYIYLDELRERKGSGYDEQDRARIRRTSGLNALFESSAAFRESVQSGKTKVHKFPFHHRKSKIPVGIPQGLPISAILANIYLYEFDLRCLDAVTNSSGGYYRRYSDDIIIVCKLDEAKWIKEFVKAGINDCGVEISPAKTETFLFKNIQTRKQGAMLTAIKIFENRCVIGAPLNYLGFEFDGQRPLIKSANLAKFYRRLIYSVKSKAKRAKKLEGEIPGTKRAVFRRQLYRLYTSRPLGNKKVHTRIQKLVRNRYGTYDLISVQKTKLMRSNYLSYVDRASEIMGVASIRNQVRKHKSTLNEAIRRHLAT